MWADGPSQKVLLQEGAMQHWWGENPKTLGVGGIHQCLVNGFSDCKDKKAFTKMQMKWEECVCEK